MAGAGAGAGARASKGAQGLIQWKDANPMEGTDVRVTGTRTDILCC